MMSSYDDPSPLSSPRSQTPDIIEPATPGGFNLAAELAAAEDSPGDDGDGHLAVNRYSACYFSDYEGSEYGDPDEDSDGYLSQHVDPDERQLQSLVDEVATPENVVGKFVHDLRGMRGQMDVENNARRYLLPPTLSLLLVSY
jgi:hypothetical protein